jgi:Ca-activated chloride channel family protein
MMEMPACHHRGDMLRRACGESFMNVRVSVCPVLALIVLFTAAAPAQQQTPFRSGSKTVAVYATVTEKGGRLIPNLAREDFEIRDSGKPQPLTVFSNELQPITVVLMLDRSGSMRGNFGLVLAAAEAFVRRLDPGDKARIGSFAERVTIEPEHFTSDREEMIRILRSGLQPPGPTPLWNAVDEAITSLGEQEGRRVVLVFSDGADAPMNLRFNNHSVMDVMRRAQQENVMVYAVGLQTTLLQGPGGRGGLSAGGLMSQRPDPSLSRIAEDTGGGYFEMNRAEKLASTFAGVADELHHQYALGFEPATLDDRMHKVEVKVARSGVKVRARNEYFAATDRNKKP